ncbi:signal peptidase II [Candidatus Pelagibacter sp.]|jgi:signal peptidase II|nr:signal peptidase II [Candidatus Pelagibacter sp.]|tara:strand:+ start:972 stop:1475 length:504 start_codon:yes stop_codon:yes gene_type:complete
MISKYLTKKFYISSTIVFFIFFLDRISKSYVINLDKLNYSSELYKSKFLNINLIWNEGIAFGLLSFDQGNLYNLISLLIAIIIVIVFFMIIKNNNIKRYPLLMIFGGAIGNLYDRITFKAVPDFIDFHIGEFHWFIFNVADIFISVGVIFMIFFELIGNSNTDHETV